MPSSDQLLTVLEERYRDFVHYNRQRLEILRRLLPPHRQRLLSLIPLLFQINHHQTPGYVDGLLYNPGVYGFRLTDELRRLRAEFVPKSRSPSTGVRRKPLIDCIASIGSAGTLAQTPKSDLDIWIVVSDEASQGTYDLLEEKAAKIHEFLLSQDKTLDMTFYMASPARVRRHYFGAVSDDSAGSALGKLLKEEFYRTCVVWTGKFPLWWCVPPNVSKMQEYFEWSAGYDMAKAPFISDIMDMGPIERSKPEQYLAAVLWQTNKSLTSPFKSLLKLTAVNAAADSPGQKSIAERLRLNVAQNPTHGRVTDPYLCLFDYCATYWRNRERDDCVRLMADMFFLKLHEGQKQKEKDKNADRMTRTQDQYDEAMYRKRAEVRGMLYSWGHSGERQRELANIKEWNFMRGMSYRADIQDFVLAAYDRVMVRLNELGIKLERGEVTALRDDVDESALSLLREFSTISQKVDTYYGRARCKIDPVPPAFREILHQNTYTFRFDPQADRGKRWALSEAVPVKVEGEEGDEEGEEGADSPAATGTTKLEAAPAEALDKSTRKLRLPTDEPKATEVRTTARCNSDGEEIEEEPSPGMDENFSSLDAAPPKPGDLRYKPTAEELESDEWEIREEALLAGGSALFLSAWLAANKLASPQTNYRLEFGGRSSAANEMRPLINKLSQLFEHPLYVDQMDESKFKEPAIPYRAFVSFDFEGQRHYRKKATDTDTVVMRKTSMAKSFKPGTILRISLAEQDSYGVVRVREVPVERYSIRSLLIRLLNNFAYASPTDVRKQVMFHSADEEFHEQFAEWMSGLFFSAHAYFQSSSAKNSPRPHFVSTIGSKLALIWRNSSGKIDVRYQEAVKPLVDLIKGPLPVNWNFDVGFDPRLPKLTGLRSLLIPPPAEEESEATKGAKQGT